VSTEHATILRKFHCVTVSEVGFNFRECRR